MKEFYVVEARQGSVVGYCGKDPVLMGDIFTKACIVKPRIIPNDFLKPAEIISERDIAAKVILILSYGEEQALIENGKSCLLLIESNDELKEGEILSC